MVLTILTHLHRNMHSHTHSNSLSPMTCYHPFAGLRCSGLVALYGMALIQHTVQPLPRADPVNVGAQGFVRHYQHVGAVAVSAQDLI